MNNEQLIIVKKINTLMYIQLNINDFSPFWFVVKSSNSNIPVIPMEQLFYHPNLCDSGQ